MIGCDVFFLHSLPFTTSESFTNCDASWRAKLLSLHLLPTMRSLLLSHGWEIQLQNHTPEVCFLGPLLVLNVNPCSLENGAWIKGCTLMLSWVFQSQGSKSEGENRSETEKEGKKYKLLHYLAGQSPTKTKASCSVTWDLFKEVTRNHYVLK